jgi:hypothetical protein
MKSLHLLGSIALVAITACTTQTVVDYPDASGTADAAATNADAQTMQMDAMPGVDATTTSPDATAGHDATPAMDAAGQPDAVAAMDAAALPDATPADDATVLPDAAPAMDAAAGNLAFGATCDPANDQCDATMGLSCHLFGQLGNVCTKSCGQDTDCPVGSQGQKCNMMGLCRP